MGNAERTCSQSVDKPVSSTSNFFSPRICWSRLAFTLGMKSSRVDSLNRKGPTPAEMTGAGPFMNL